MLLTRSLPPQFLLPAWSAAQLAHAVQRAHKSGNNTEFELIRKTETRHRPGTYSMMKFKRLPFLKERMRGQVQEQMQEQAEDEPSEEALSLYDELFPEERRHAKERRRKAEERLDKLPAFKWNMDRKPRRPIEKDREKKSNESNPFRAIAQSAVPALEQAQAPLWGRARGREASLLILRAVSKTLEESDFFRIGPKGEHIEGWTSGLTKGIYEKLDFGKVADTSQLFKAGTVPRWSHWAITSSSSPVMPLHELTSTKLYDYIHCQEQRGRWKIHTFLHRLAI